MKVCYMAVVGFPGYRVGTDGSVWTCWRRRAFGQGKGTKFVLSDKWKQLKPELSKGYWRVCLYRNGKSYRRRIHCLSLEAFVGPRPPKLMGCHNDGNRNNNCSDNLRWGTQASNLLDRIKHGTHPVGETTPNGKLTGVKVRKIVARAAAGQSRQALASRFAVDVSAINKILRGTTWSHITGIGVTLSQEP
jgi:hypothetical protein